MFSIDTLISDAGLFLIALCFMVEGLLLWKIGSPFKQIDWIRHTRTGKNAFAGIAIVFAVFLVFVIVGFFTLAEASQNGERITKGKLLFFPYAYVEAALDTPQSGKFSPQCERGGDQVASNLRIQLGLMRKNRFEMFSYIGHQSCAVGEDWHTEDTYGFGARLYLFKK